jgi:hypothetical protein
MKTLLKSQRRHLRRLLEVGFLKFVKILCLRGSLIIQYFRFRQPANPYFIKAAHGQ